LTTTRDRIFEESLNSLVCNAYEIRLEKRDRRFLKKKARIWVGLEKMENQAAA